MSTASPNATGCVAHSKKPRRRRNLKSLVPPGRKRAYSKKEAERIARFLPLDRAYSPIEAAFAVSQYLDLDPAFWLEQAGLAGMSATLHQGRLCQYFPDADSHCSDFLRVWLNIAEGTDAVVALLRKRAGQAPVGGAHA